MTSAFGDWPYVTRPPSSVRVPILKRITDRDFGEMLLVPGRTGLEWDPLGQHADDYCEEIVEWIGVFSRPGLLDAELSLSADVEDAICMAVRAVAEGEPPGFEDFGHLEPIGSKVWEELRHLPPGIAPGFGWAKAVPFEPDEKVRAMFRETHARFDEVWADMRRQAIAAAEESNARYRRTGHGRERDPQDYEKLRLTRVGIWDRAYFNCGPVGFNFGPGQPPHLEWFD